MTAPQDARPAAPNKAAVVSKKPLTATQTVCLVLAHVLSLGLLGLVYVWGSTKNDSDNAKRNFYLGGLGASRAKVFNWHPVLMVAAFGFCMTQAVLAFRTLPLGKARNKTLHALWHTLAIVCFSFGLAAVWRSHDRPPAKDGAHSADLYSPHSMVGLFVVMLAGLQYLVGAFAYVAPCASAALKKSLLPHHVVIGVVVYVASFTAIVSGAAETALVRLKCGYYTGSYDAAGDPVKYDLDEKDADPALHYHYVPDGCKVAAGVAVTAVLTLLCTLVAVLSLKVGAESDAPPAKAADSAETADPTDSLLPLGVGLTADIA